MSDGGALVSFGVLDIFVLGGVAGLALYWFVLRKPKVEPGEFKKLTVNPTVQRSQSYDPSFVNKMKRTGKNIVVFYGSQTGTAEEFSNRLAKDANRYGMKGMVADPEECEMEDLTKLTEIDRSLAVFVMATYGEGDPTDNAQGFYDWLKDSATDLTGVRYAVFGLGNKTYEHYNAIGKTVDQKLEALGATRICELGLGDDDGNIEEDFVSWREKFWPAVCEQFGVTSVGEDVSVRQFTVTVHDDVPTDKVFAGEPARLGSLKTQRPPFDAKNPFLAPVSVNRELHTCGDRHCMHIEFDITGSKMRYDAGDHVAVFPVNDSELVAGLEKRLNADFGQVISLNNVDEEASKKTPFPCPTTYRTAFTHYLDITSPVRTNVLKELAEYTQDPAEKEKLLKMASSTPEGKELYMDWIVHDHRHILAVLEDMPSIQPPLDHLCELLHRLHPRYYSISSSYKMYNESVHITAVLVDWKTKTGRNQRGVATYWLSTKLPTNGLRPTVPIYIRKSTFRLPFKSTLPIIMIGPGTGLAPFRGFIQERAMLKKEGKTMGDTILYFGCRKQSEDYLYREELEQYLADGVLTKLYVAFSRDSDKKVYVQNLISQDANRAEIWKILEEGGHIYVCGDARHMAHDVDLALKEIVKKEGGRDETAAVEYLKKLRARSKYNCDVWS